MKVLGIFFCLTLAAFASDVLDLKESSFEDELDKHGLVLVEFFAPWCGHCKKLAPEYEKAATKLASNDPPIVLAKVDCVADDSKELCTKYGVSGYPTLKLFKNFKKDDPSSQTPEDYNGPREANGIVSYMKARGGPSSKELKTKEDFEKSKDAEDHIIIGFFSDASSEIAREFLKAAESLRENFDFAHTYNKELQELAGVSDNEVVIMRPSKFHTKLEEAVVKLGNAAAKKSDIQSFVKSKFAGAAGLMTSDNQQYFDKPVAVAYFQVDYVKNAKGTNYWRNRVLKVAQKFAGKMTFAIASKEEFGAQLDDMGIDTNSADVNVVVWNAAGGKFRMDPEIAFSMESLEAFVNSFLDGKVEEYLKSEDVPEDNSGPVKTVVAKNFNEIVNDPEKDVLIEFYAPWCGHCKSLEPKYKELGEKLEGEDSVTIAKMDATANDVPQPYQVKGFPTIYWSPKGNKSKPKKYEGGREVKDFLSYIKKEASNKNLKLSGKDEL